MKETRDKVEGHIQKSKLDWWDCNCGKQHKGFPYKCPEQNDQTYCHCGDSTDNKNGICDTCAMLDDMNDQTKFEQFWARAVHNCNDKEAIMKGVIKEACRKSFKQGLQLEEQKGDVGL